LGKRIGIVGPSTREIREAKIFVGVPGASNLIYAEATWTQALLDSTGDRIDPHLRRSFTFDNDTAFREQALLRNMRHTTGFATLTPHRKKAASKTPTDTYVDGCRTTWISTGPAGHPADRPHDQLIPVNALV
jgi:hypothetical protein